MAFFQPPLQSETVSARRMAELPVGTEAMIAALQQQLAALNVDRLRERELAEQALAREQELEQALAREKEFAARESVRADAAVAALNAASTATAAAASFPSSSSSSSSAAAAAVPSLKPLPSPTAGGAKALLEDAGYWGLLPAPVSFVPPGGVAQAFAPALAAAAGAARTPARAAESLMDEATFYRLAGVCAARARAGVRGAGERAQGLWGLRAALAALDL
jgi:hypothetical protein